MQQPFQHEDGEGDAGDASHQREQQRLAQQLEDDLAPPRAKRGADSEFRLPGRASSQQQSGDISAGDEQQRGDGGEEDAQSGTDVAGDGLRLRNHLGAAVVQVFLGITFGQSCLDGVHLGLGLGHGHAGLEAADRVKLHPSALRCGGTLPSASRAGVIQKLGAGVSTGKLKDAGMTPTTV